MNKYLKNLEKREFVVTDGCTGRCKHCSQGEHRGFGECIDPMAAARVVRSVCGSFPIKTVMAFGGEPLLHPEAVYAIMDAASECGVARRQLITNGFFTSDREKMADVAKRLSRCGVNDLLLSVDAFHQETIPLDTVKAFAKFTLEMGIPVRLQPAWLVSPDDLNEYNVKTREILNGLSDLGLEIGSGNIVFAEGNAKKYLAKYFDENSPQNPYVEDVCDVKCLSVESNGNVLGGNICAEDILGIIKKYAP